jgi:hypothetical protein
MRLKVLLAAMFLGGILVGTSAADPDDKPFKDAEKAERKAIAVPEPSAMLLSALGMGAVLVGGWVVRRREGHRPISR